MRVRGKLQVRNAHRTRCIGNEQVLPGEREAVAVALLVAREHLERELTRRRHVHCDARLAIVHCARHDARVECTLDDAS